VDQQSMETETSAKFNSQKKEPAQRSMVKLPIMNEKSSIETTDQRERLTSRKRALRSDLGKVRVRKESHTWERRILQEEGCTGVTRSELLSNDGNLSVVSSHRGTWLLKRRMKKGLENSIS